MAVFVSGMTAYPKPETPIEKADAAQKLAWAAQQCSRVVMSAAHGVEIMVGHVATPKDVLQALKSVRDSYRQLVSAFGEPPEDSPPKL